jgi:hypothetical protein
MTVVPENDDHEMLVFDHLISDPKNLTIAKDFVGNMVDRLFEPYKVLPFARKLHLLRLYVEKNFDAETAENFKLDLDRKENADGNVN